MDDISGVRCLMKVYFAHMLEAFPSSIVVKLEF